MTTPAERSALEALGLAPGEQVRFRRADRARWQLGTVARLERDGSLRVTDADGGARAVPLAGVEVQRPRVRARSGRAAGAGGGAPAIRWEPLAERSSRSVQLTLGW